MARDLAMRILDDDPDLKAYEHQEIEREMRARFPENTLDVVQSGLAPHRRPTCAVGPGAVGSEVCE